MKVDFYYWSYQCPLNYLMIDLLREYEDKLNIKYHDISNDEELAKKLNIYFPTLIIVNEKYRFYSPLKKSFLDKLVNGEIPSEVQYRPQLGTRVKIGKISPITKDNIKIACQCTGYDCSEGYHKKLEFCTKNNNYILGFVNVDSDNDLLGGAEYMPSCKVPYDIPKDEKTAFITCTYISNSKYDYKTGALKELERYLSHDFERVIVIADKTGVFPNGDINFFLNNNYLDEGIVFKDDYCELHLLSKDL